MSNVQAEFPRVTPEAAGLDPAAILNFVDEIETAGAGLHSFLILKGGRVAAEGYWQPYRRNDYAHIFSLTKSFTSLGVGFALQEGKLSLADPVSKYFAADFPEPVPERLARLTVRDLLTMQSGHVKDTMPAMNQAARGGMARAFFAQELAHDPGTFFLYNNGASNILSKIITRATGQTLEQYLTPRLLEPLGIRPLRWETDPEGDTYGGWGLYLNTEDIARFGQFCLQRGRHAGKQLLNADYVLAATIKQNAGPGLDPNSEWWPAYGYHFWQDRHGAGRADGAGGQLAILLDELDTVLVFTAWSDDIAAIFRIAYQTLVPALRGDDQTGRKVSQEELATRLAHLSLPLPEAVTPAVGLPSLIELTFPAEPEQPEKIRLQLAGKKVALTTAGTTIDFSFKHWEWQEESDAGWVFLTGSFHRRALWTGPDELTLLLYRDPVHTRLQFKFDGDQVHLKISGRSKAERRGHWVEPQNH